MCCPAFHSDKLSLYRVENTCQGEYGQHDLPSAVSWLSRWQKPAGTLHECEGCTPKVIIIQKERESVLDYVQHLEVLKCA